MERPGRPSRDKVQVTPDPVRPDLFEFLEKHFDGQDQKPEKIELRQAFGPGGTKYRTIVIQKEFKANAAKPSREQLVALANELLDLSQRNCDELGKPQKYAVLMKHHGKSSEYYGAFLIALRPKQPPQDSDEFDEDDVTATDAKRRDALLEYSLAHLKQGDEAERYRQDQFSTATGDILEKYQALLAMTMQQLLEMQREHRELYKTADEALSKKAERELAAQMQQFKMGMMRDGFQFLKQMAPVVVNQLNGKEATAGQPSPESLAVETFLEGLNEQQAQLLFGTERDGKLQPDGIFTNAQAMIFASVAACKSPPSELDKLLDGEHAVTPEQITKAQGVVSPQQFMPLVALVMQRRKQIPDSATSQTASPTP